MKLQIEIRHREPNIWIPRASRSYVEKTGACLRDNLAAIFEPQAQFLSRLQRFRENHGNQIVAAPRQLAALNRRVVNVLQRLAV